MHIFQHYRAAALRALRLHLFPVDNTLLLQRAGNYGDKQYVQGTSKRVTRRPLDRHRQARVLAPKPRSYASIGSFVDLYHCAPSTIARSTNVNLLAAEVLPLARRSKEQVLRWLR